MNIDKQAELSLKNPENIIENLLTMTPEQVSEAMINTTFEKIQKIKQE